MMTKTINIRYTLLFLAVCTVALFSWNVSTGQNAPVTTIATVGNAQPGLVPVPITVTGFSNIGACSLSFDYPYAGLHFSFGTPNPDLAGFAIGDHDLGNGKHRVTMGWFGSGTTLPDGTAIMTVTFTLISGINALEFYDNGPSCEYADGNFNVLNDVPQGSFYINGMVCTGIGSPGSITGPSSVCPGETGAGYSISPVANATGYLWTIPPGATIITGNNTNSITVDYSLVANSGLVTVCGANVCGNGPVSQLPVTVNVIPVANAGNDVTIPYGTSTTLHAASGGAGSFNYHWSPEAMLVNPNLQNPQTVNLTGTQLFTLSVTNQATLCQNSDEVVVAISGGPLNANPVANPATICNGTPAQLFANAGGGSGTYTYSWSSTPSGTPPWTSTLANPIVTPDVTTVYHLNLSDGFNATTSSTSVVVYPLPTATIHGGDTLCGSGNSTTLTVDLTGTPPWSFYYSNGITTWFVQGLYSTPYAINATEAGIYTILAMTDEHCTGTATGSAAVGVFPVPPTPAISINGTELTSTGCCGNQWYKEGVLIPGATNQDYEPVASAHYYTIVTIDGCSSEPSNTIFYFMTGLDAGKSNIFTIGPNPARNSFHVTSVSGIRYLEELKIRSITGRIEAAFSIHAFLDQNGIIIDLQPLSPGLYFVELESKTTKTILKLVIQ